jgi:hypothetical protein
MPPLLSLRDTPPSPQTRPSSHISASLGTCLRSIFLPLPAVFCLEVSFHFPRPAPPSSAHTDPGSFGIGCIYSTVECISGCELVYTYSPEAHSPAPPLSIRPRRFFQTSLSLLNNGRAPCHLLSFYTQTTLVFDTLYFDRAHLPILPTARLARFIVTRQATTLGNKRSFCPLACMTAVRASG